MGKKLRVFTYALGGVGAAALAAAIAIAASPALSQGMSGHGGGHGGGHGWGHGDGRPFLGFLEEMDADNNGAVSRAEIDRFSAARAAEIDADQDGQITVDELQAFHDAQRKKRLGEHLAAMDADGDGKVTVAELQAASTWRLARFDRDGDGVIERRGDKRHHGVHQHDHRGPDGGRN